MREIEFFFDIGSSYSYLAATQMEGVAERTKVPVRWRPFLLGGVFKATGNDMPARLPAKAKWGMAAARSSICLMTSRWPTWYCGMAPCQRAI